MVILTLSAPPTAQSLQTPVEGLEWSLKWEIWLFAQYTIRTQPHLRCLKSAGAASEGRDRFKEGGVYGGVGET